MDFADWWAGYVIAAGGDPDECGPTMVADALGAAWMAAARDLYRDHFSNLYDFVQVKDPTEYPDLFPETEPNDPGEPWQIMSQGYGLRIKGLPVQDYILTTDGEIDKRLSFGLQTLHLNLLADGKGFPIPTDGGREHYHPNPDHPQQGNVHFTISHAFKDKVKALADWWLTLIAGFEAAHTIWQSVDPAKRSGLKHPLAPLIEGLLREQRRKAKAPERVKVLTAGAAQLARVPNETRTIALATWEQLPDAAIVEVDGEPVSTPLHYGPRRSRGRKGDTLIPLPGTLQAEDIRLALLQEQEQHAGVDRRAPLAGDTFYLCGLSSAIQGDLTLKADRLGAMMAGRFDSVGVGVRQKRRWRDRAWAAVRWASAFRRLPDGNYFQVVGITAHKPPLGTLTINPFSWGDHGKGYRLSGVLTAQLIRGDKNGSLSRLVAGMEDYLAASEPTPSSGGLRARLLIPPRPGGPGPTSAFIPYPVLLGRAGFYFDLADPRSEATMRELWRRLVTALHKRGYVLPSPRAEAPAGDTVEVVKIVKGGRGGYGGLQIRASARYTEAQDLVARRRGDRGLGSAPLAALFAE